MVDRSVEVVFISLNGWTRFFIVATNFGCEEKQNAASRIFTKLLNRVERENEEQRGGEGFDT